MRSSKTALVVGGSGMLAGTCRELAKKYNPLGVVGRTKIKMQNLTEFENVVPIYVDYHDSEALQNALGRFVGEYGKPELTVAWIHTSAPDAVPIVAKHCKGSFYEVTGTSGAQKDHISHRHEELIKPLDLKYHRIILGQAGNRWLTHNEVSKGVYRAIVGKAKESVVGEL